MMYRDVMHRNRSIWSDLLRSGLPSKVMSAAHRTKRREEKIREGMRWDDIQPDLRGVWRHDTIKLQQDYSTVVMPWVAFNMVAMFFTRWLVCFADVWVCVHTDVNCSVRVVCTLYSNCDASHHTSYHRRLRKLRLGETRGRRKKGVSEGARDIEDSRDIFITDLRLIV